MLHNTVVLYLALIVYTTLWNENILVLKSRINWLLLPTQIYGLES